MIIIVFIGFRGHLMTDFIIYYDFFEKLPVIWNLKPSNLERFEPGFVIYSSLIKTLIPNYFGWVIVNTIIDVIVLNITFKRYSQSIILSWFFMISFMGLLIEFNLFRNIKAIDLYLLSIPFIYKRKFVPFLMINLLGATFHSSAIIFLPTYFIVNQYQSRKILVIGFILVNIIFLFRIFPTTFIINKLSAYSDIVAVSKVLYYSNSGSEGTGISFGYIERVVTFILCLLYENKLRRKHDYNSIFCNCYYIYFFLFHLFADVAVFTSRFSYLFVFSYWLIGPNLLYLVKAVNRQIVWSGVFCLCFVKIILANSTIISRYDNTITGIQNYEQRKSIIMIHPELAGG